VSERAQRQLSAILAADVAGYDAHCKQLLEQLLDGLRKAGLPE
jgi:hypothetical protein